MDDTFYMPIELVRAVPIGMDVGTSICKILYRAKQDKEYNSDPKQKQGRLRIKLLPILANDDEMLDGVVSFLQEHCDFDTPKRQVSAYVTGVQVGKMEKLFLDQFGIKFEYVAEFPGMVNAAAYFSKCDLGPADLFYSHSEQAVKDGKKNAALLNSVVDLIAPHNSDARLSQAGLYIRKKYELPSLFVQIGTVTSCIKVLEDETLEPIEASFKGGRALHSLAKLITGETNFDKVMDMARQGNLTNVDSTMAELLPTTVNPDNPYNATNYGDCELPTAVLGKVLKADITTLDHKDLLSSFVNMFTAEIARMSQMAALLHNLPRIYFCGSLVNHALIRERITQEFAMRYGSCFTHGRPPVEFQFLKSASYMGALGAYLENMKAAGK